MAKKSNGIEAKIGKALDEVICLSGHERLSAVDAILQAVLSSNEIAWEPDTKADDAPELAPTTQRCLREIATVVVTRARGEAFNEFMQDMGRLDPQGSVKQSVKEFQTAWRKCGEFDAFSEWSEYCAKVERKTPAREPAAGTRDSEFQSIRTQLFEATGIVHCVKRAMLADEYASTSEVDTTRLQNSLDVACRLMLAAADRLESL